MNAPPSIAYDDLAARIYKGDRTAEELLFQHLQHPILNMLRTRCRDPQLAEDLMQDTFGVLLTRLREKPLNESNSLGRFVHKTAVNIWIGHLRKEERRKTSPDNELIENTPSEDDEQGRQLEQVQQANAVRMLLNDLKNARDREILFRSFVLDHDKIEICEALELSKENFDRVIYRAKRRFRQILEDQSDIRP